MSAIIDSFMNSGFDFIDILIVGGISFAGYKLLLSRSNNKTGSQSSSSIKSVVNRSEHIKNTESSNFETAPVRKNPNNIKHLEDIKISLETLSILYSRIVFLNVFHSGYKKIALMRSDLAFLENEEWTSEQLKYYVDYVINMDFSDSVPSIKDAIERMCTFTTNFYDEILDEVFGKVDSSHSGMKSAFIMPPDKKIEQQTRVKSAILPLFSDAIQSFDLSSRMQAYLRKDKQKFDKSTSKDFDWGFVAKHFGHGLIAGISPVAGVPMILKNMFGEIEASKNKQQFINDYIKNVDECLTNFDAIGTMLHTASAKASDYCLGRSQELHSNSIFFVCSKLDAQGVNLAPVCRAIVDLVAEINKELAEG